MARLNLNVRRWRGMTGIGGGITGRIGGCLGPVVCTVSARMSGAEFSVGLAVVSINTAQHESLRATCMTLAVGQRQWGSINPPGALCSGWLWWGGERFCQLHVCSCVLGRCARSVGNAPFLIGCSAPDRV